MTASTITSARIAAETQYQNSFEKLLTQFTRVTLITKIACALIGGGLYLTLNYFERSIDGIDDNPQGFVQKSYNKLIEFSWVLLSASFYIGLQGFLLSQIINIGHYACYRTGAIHYQNICAF